MSYWSRNQWIENAKERVLQNTKRTDDYARELIFLYDEAAFNIEKEIEALFSRFAKDNGLTEEAARQLLEGKEYSVWRKSIEEYIAEASDAAKDSKALLELNTLAMKSRITRKEQLLANVYQNMIDLAEDSITRLDTLLGDTPPSFGRWLSRSPMSCKEKSRKRLRAKRAASRTAGKSALSSRRVTPIILRFTPRWNTRSLWSMATATGEAEGLCQAST